VTGRIIFTTLVVLGLLAGLAAVGAYVYNAGVAQGLLQSENVQVVVPEAGGGAVPYVPYARPFWWGPWGFGFGCFGLLIPLLLVFLLFAALRGLFWGGPWAWRGGWHRPWGHKPWMGEGRGVPPFFEEWHKRAHGEGEAPRSE
jgi:hypothetical protein